jgi:outer membrane protein
MDCASSNTKKRISVSLSQPVRFGIDTQRCLEYALRSFNIKQGEDAMRDANVVKLFMILSLSAILAVGFSTMSLAQGTKMADVSMTDISNKSQKVKSALEELRKFQSEPTPKMTSLSLDIRKVQESLEKDKANLKEADKDKLEDEIRTKYQELQQEQQLFRTKVMEQQKVVNDSMMSQINQSVAKVAEQEGIAVVFLKESIIYSKDMPDITDKVISHLDSTMQQAPAKK